jgi:putative membrane protein
MSGFDPKSMVMAVLLIGAASAPAVAQEPGSRETRDYVQAAEESDTFEMMEAYTALAQSTDPQVIAFARRMIRDHGQTGRRLREATAQAGLMPPPAAVGAAQSPFLAALQSARGHDFDMLYWRQQALAHRSALTVTQLYAETGDAPAVRQAAAAAVPLIRAHLAMAEQMSARAGS